jgi:hypothetical protein
MGIREYDNLNWLISYTQTELDTQVTPLTLAAFLGRKRIVELLLQNASLNLNLPT